ncbi:MAG: CapA family protein [Ignavibacteria bacterium]|nr:CapA family protein [Ignavibacteria bacterium]
MKLSYLILFFLLLLFVSCKPEKPKGDNSSKEINEIKKELPKEETLYSVIAVGDIMMGTTYPSRDLPPNDGENLFDGVSEILNDADLTMGNLEGPLLNSGGTPKKCRDSLAKCYSFRTPEHYAGYLSNAGFDYMNMANNHAGDMGEAGRNSTYKVLESENILYAGTDEYPTAIFETKGKKFGIAGFAPNRGTISINDLDNAENVVKELKSKCDFVIVMFHGGAEGPAYQHVPKRKEEYLGENRGDVYEFAHTVIDAGADAVFGHGPHVTRAVEIYKKKFIAYSLGNFCTYGKFGLSGVQGISPIMKIYINEKGNFIRAEVTSVRQIKRGFPVLDENETVYKVLKKLSNEDFPGNLLKFSDNGFINFPG